MRTSIGMKTISRQKVDGPDPRYYRVWVDHYCVADGIGPLRSWVLCRVLRRLGR